MISTLRTTQRITIVSLLVGVLAGCGALPRSEQPATVESRSAEPPAAAVQHTPQIAAYTPPAAPRYARPAPKRAVEVLMAKADEQRRQGDLVGATVSLERALRIAPPSDSPLMRWAAQSAAIR